VATSHLAAMPLAPSASSCLSGVGGWWGARSCGSAHSLSSRFPFLVLLGLGLHLPPTDFGAEVEAGRTALRWDGVGGAAVVKLTIPRSPAMVSPLLLRADFSELCAVVWYDREALLAPFLLVPLSSPLPDLDVRHLGAALLPLMSMVEFLVPVVNSLRRIIRNLQACDDVGVPTELLCGSFGSSSSDLRSKMEVGYCLSHFL
jgi:hypothetical protein